MHPNYQRTFALSGAAALPQRPILSNRPGVTACVLRDAGEPDLMR